MKERWNECRANRNYFHLKVYCWCCGSRGIAFCSDMLLVSRQMFVSTLLCSLACSLKYLPVVLSVFTCWHTHDIHSTHAHATITDRCGWSYVDEYRLLRDITRDTFLSNMWCAESVHAHSHTKDEFLQIDGNIIAIIVREIRYYDTLVILRISLMNLEFTFVKRTYPIGFFSSRLVWAHCSRPYNAQTTGKHRCIVSVDNGLESTLLRPYLRTSVAIIPFDSFVSDGERRGERVRMYLARYVYRLWGVCAKLLRIKRPTNAAEKKRK